MCKTKGGLALTTKNGEDNKVLEEAIRANGQLKEKVTIRLPSKRNPKIIVYKVTKETTEE